MKTMFRLAILTGLLTSVVGCGGGEEILVDFQYTPGSNGSAEKCSTAIITNRTKFDMKHIIINFFDDGATVRRSNIKSGGRAEAFVQATKAGLTCAQLRDLGKDDFEISFCELEGEISSECKRLVNINN